MSRVTAIICGVMVFGLGLFLGMVGMFFLALPVDSAHPNPARKGSKPSATTHLSLTSRPSPTKADAVPGTEAEEAEKILSQALTLVAEALAAQSSTNEPAKPTVALATEESPENMEEEPATPPSSNPPQLTQTPTAKGRWIFDPQLGWVWLPESAKPAPVVEVYPGGTVAIRGRTIPPNPNSNLNSKMKRSGPGTSERQTQNGPRSDEPRNK